MVWYWLWTAIVILNLLDFCIFRNWLSWYQTLVIFGCKSSPPTLVLETVHGSSTPPDHSWNNSALQSTALNSATTQVYVITRLQLHGYINIAEVYCAYPRPQAPQSFQCITQHWNARDLHGTEARFGRGQPLHWMLDLCSDLHVISCIHPHTSVCTVLDI